SQNADGSWLYGGTQRNNFYRDRWRDSMTCAGLLALAVGQGVRQAGAPQADEPGQAAAPEQTAADTAMEQGFRFLGGVIRTSTALPAAEREARRQQTARQFELRKRLGFGTGSPEEFRSLPTRLQQEIVGAAKELDRLEQDPTVWRGALIDRDAWGDLYFLWSVEPA